MKKSKLLAILGMFAFGLALIAIVILSWLGLLDRYIVLVSVLFLLGIVLVDLSGRFNEKDVEYSDYKFIDQVREKRDKEQ